MSLVSLVKFCLQSNTVIGLFLNGHRRIEYVLFFGLTIGLRYFEMDGGGGSDSRD